MRQECYFCNQNGKCSGYTEGCYDKANGVSVQKVEDQIKAVDKAVDDMGARHLFSMSFSEFLSKQ